MKHQSNVSETLIQRAPRPIRHSRERTSACVKVIEDIQVGDLVRSWDHELERAVRRRVERLFFRRKRSILEVELLRDEYRQSILATPEHPFWVDGEGWTPARRLKTGDPLKHLDGKRPIIVQKVTEIELDRDVFNFEVGGAHNYFVGNSAVLVHNESEVQAVAPKEPRLTIDDTTLGRWKIMSPSDRAEQFEKVLGRETLAPLFQDNGFGPALKVKGKNLSLEDVATQVTKLYSETPELAVAANGLLFHGTNSASLLAVTRRMEGLLPVGKLIELKSPPFSGTLDPGITSVGAQALSTTFVINSRGAYSYAFPLQPTQPWTPAVGKENLRALSEIDGKLPSNSPYAKMVAPLLQIENFRIGLWDNLSAQERRLVSDSFPLVWRFKPSPQRTVKMVMSSVHMEMGMFGGANWNETVEVHVPSSEISRVESLFKEYSLNIPARPFVESLMPSRRR